MMGATATMLDQASDYLRRGFAPIPIPIRQKGPAMKGWQDLRLTEADLPKHFSNGCSNIGLLLGKPSGGLTDVDLDSPEALALGHLLPTTGWVSGRSSNPYSHYWFITEPRSTVKYQDPTDGAMLLELRGTGGQTVVPGSIHPSGEPYVWHHHTEPARVNRQELQAAVSYVAGLALLARHWPTQGRQDTALALAGGLLRAGWTAAKVREALQSVCNAAQDEETPKRVKTVDCTEKALADGEEVTGWPKVSELLGDKVVAKAREWLGCQFAATGNDAPEEHTQEDKSLKAALIEYRDLLTLELPERKRYLPWLVESSNVMIYGPRGVGKTMANLGLATALVSGTKFLEWPVTEPVGVLYVDGEMQLDDLRNRATAFLASPPKAPLYFLTSELVYHRLHRDLALTTPAVREEIMRILEQEPDIRVVIFDNISSLCTGIDEQSKRDWEPIAAWLTRLRHRGLTTALVHHGGKSGDQRGTSGREDSLDIVIRLGQPAGYDPREGCHFELRFTKSRGVKGDDVAALDIRLADDKGKFCWIVKLIEESHFDRVKQLIVEGVTSPTEIAEELGITKGYASKLVRKVRAAEGTA